MIGSSPVCLLEALYRDGAGESVIVVDDKPVLGGAWDFGSLDRYAYVESCAHILRYHPGCYRFFEEYLGLRMAPLEPFPVGYSCRPHRRPRGTRYETWRWKLRYVGDRIDHVGFPRTWRGVKRYLVRPLIRAAILAFDQLRGRMPVQEYPVGGTPAMVESLRALIAHSTVTVRLATRVNSVEIRGPITRLRTADSTITCRRLVITTQTRLSGIHDGVEHLGPLGDDGQSVQLLLLADDPGPVTCSFLEFNGHPHLRRVSDVTRFAKWVAAGAPDEKIIAATFRTGVQPQEGLVQATVDQLKELNVISAAARLRRHEWRTYRTTSQRHAVMQRVRRRFGSRIEVLSTADLAESVERHAPRWATVLRPYRQVIGDCSRPGARAGAQPGDEQELAAAA